MKNEYSTMKEWMEFAWMPAVAGAEKYTIGQGLTPEQAQDIMRIVAESMEFDLYSNSDRNRPFTHGEPYYDFIGAYSLLMVQVGPENTNHWAWKLWQALSYWDQKTLARYFKKKFGVDIRNIIL